MVDVDKQFWGEHKDPLEPTNQALFLQVLCRPQGFAVRCGGAGGAVRSPPMGAQVSFLRLDGFPGWSGGHAPLLRLGRRGGPSVPLRPAAPQGARTHAFPHPAPLPSDEWEP